MAAQLVLVSHCGWRWVTQDSCYVASYYHRLWYQSWQSALGVPEFWSDDPRDHRRRSGAILLADDGRVILMDCGPDLSHQLTDPYKTWDRQHYPDDCIVRCDGLLLTHDHADHSHGINELRHLNRLMGGDSITIYGSDSHLNILEQSFPYCFGSGYGTYRLSQPALQTQRINWQQEVVVAGMRCLPLEVSHGPAGPVTAFRCGNMAYVTDAKEVPPQTMAQLQQLDLLVLGCLREEPHNTHLNWQEASALIEQLQPDHTVLVHSGYEVRYAEWEQWLPANVTLAYDGWYRDLDLSSAEVAL